MVDEKGYKNKPNKYMGSITKRMSDIKNSYEIDLNKLAYYIVNGHTFSVSYAEGGMSDNNFVSSDLVGLDFDGKLTVKQVLDMLNKHNITSNIVYYTYSHNEKGERFRVVTALSERITDCNEYKKIIKGYQSLFGENTDNATVAAVQRFLGTNKGLVQKVDAFNTTNKQVFLDLYNKLSNNTQKHFTHFDLNREIENFNLLDYITCCYNVEKLKPQADGYFVEPCPFCGHKGHFKVTGNAFHSFGSSPKCCHVSGYGIIQFLKFQFGFDNKQAVNYFKYDILKLDRNIIAFKNNDTNEKLEEHRPSYIVKTENGEKVHTAKLANYILKNIKFISIDDASRTIRRFLYIDNYYKYTTDRQFKRFIRDIIASYNEDLCTNYVHERVLKNVDDGADSANENDLNTHEYLINFQNGILDLNTMELLEHTPDLLITRQVPCNWSEDTPETPYFDKYLDDLSSGDEDVKKLLMQYMGAIFSNVKGSRFKKALFLEGTGNTGKSQLKLLTERILGRENCTAVDLEQLETRFGTANLYNKRLAGSSDMNVSFVDHLTIFKRLTGGDYINVENKGKDAFEMRYEGFLWFCTNEMPNFGGDKGKWVYDRMIIVKCNNVIPFEKRNPELCDKMYAEREGIVKKCIIEARTAIINKRFDIPDKCIRHLEEFRIETNSVVRFCLDCLQPLGDDEKPDIKKSALYEVYKAWCKHEGIFAISKVKFTNEIAMYYEKPKKDIFIHTRNGDVLADLTVTKEIYIKYNDFFME